MNTLLSMLSAAALTLGLLLLLIGVHRLRLKQQGPGAKLLHGPCCGACEFDCPNQQGLSNEGERDETPG